MRTIRLAVLTVSALALLSGVALASFRTGPYHGKTAQRLVISFVVHRHTVTRLTYAVRYRCSTGIRYTGSELLDTTVFRIRNGRFGGRSQSPSGATKSEIHAQLGGSSATGIVRRTIRINTVTNRPDPAGNELCDSGRVRFSAHLVQ